MNSELILGASLQNYLKKHDYEHLLNLSKVNGETIDTFIFKIVNEYLEKINNEIPPIPLEARILH